MRSQSEIILGISIGTNTVGLALIKNRELTDWSIKTYNGQWSRYKEQSIVNSIINYIERNQVSVVAFKSPEDCRSSQAVKGLTKIIHKHCLRRKIGFHTVGINIIKRVTGCKNKHELMRFIADKYPEMRQKVKRQEKSKNHYYFKLFEALGAAMLCL
jgi:hypothetical protein